AGLAVRAVQHRPARRRVDVDPDRGRHGRRPGPVACRAAGAGPPRGRRLPAAGPRGARRRTGRPVVVGARPDPAGSRGRRGGAGGALPAPPPRPADPRTRAGGAAVNESVVEEPKTVVAHRTPVRGPAPTPTPAGRDPYWYAAGVVLLLSVAFAIRHPWSGDL